MSRFNGHRTDEGWFWKVGPAKPRAELVNRANRANRDTNYNRGRETSQTWHRDGVAPDRQIGQVDRRILSQASNTFSPRRISSSSSFEADPERILENRENTKIARQSVVYDPERNGKYQTWRQQTLESIRGDESSSGSFHNQLDYVHSLAQAPGNTQRSVTMGETETTRPINKGSNHAPKDSWYSGKAGNFDKKKHISRKKR